MVREVPEVIGSNRETVHPKSFCAFITRCQWKIKVGWRLQTSLKMLLREKRIYDYDSKTKKQIMKWKKNHSQNIQGIKIKILPIFFLIRKIMLKKRIPPEWNIKFRLLLGGNETFVSKDLQKETKRMFSLWRLSKSQSNSGAGLKS